MPHALHAVCEWSPELYSTVVVVVCGCMHAAMGVPGKTHFTRQGTQELAVARRRFPLPALHAAARRAGVRAAAPGVRVVDAPAAIHAALGACAVRAGAAALGAAPAQRVAVGARRTVWHAAATAAFGIATRLVPAVAAAAHVGAGSAARVAHCTAAAQVGTAVRDRGRAFAPSVRLVGTQGAGLVAELQIGAA
eukprot:CAMPEP_0177642416 /NCGR_PEP_ID=MMETSP0447-20121125/7575_1 /TAXON_ID=0 /ORGANISM="Stygamoeba regulata, Strain BSH-02190019" /LENGTH=192 /DNA_ID=CAMNT_0019144573 /DNA_START=183 /DNA_END=762 /DNA_ORIENTATION=-